MARVRERRLWSSPFCPVHSHLHRPPFHSPSHSPFHIPFYRPFHSPFYSPLHGPFHDRARRVHAYRYDRLEDVGWTVRILGVLILLSYWVVLPATLIPLVIVPAMTSPPPSPPSPPSPPGAPHPWPFPPNAPGAPFPPTVVDCSLEPTNSTLYAEFCSSDEEGDWWSSNWWWIFLVIIGGCSVFGKEDD